MRVLAIDIASKNTGWAFVVDGKVSKKHLGLITIPPKQPMGKRLQDFANALKKLIEQTKPDVVVIEDIFVGRNVKTFKVLSQFSGIAIKTIYETTGKDPVVISVSKARSRLGIKNNKLEAFEYINEKYKLNYDFKADNDITDALVLALSGIGE